MSQLSPKQLEQLKLLRSGALIVSLYSKFEALYLHRRVLHKDVDDPLFAPYLTQLPQATPASIRNTQSASALLTQATSPHRFSSGSKALDSLITARTEDKGGLPQGRLLELSGAPGEGKTRACTSFAINACLDGENRASDPRVLIIGECH